MTSVLKREKERRDSRHREEDYVKAKVETGIMLPQAKECEETPQSGRGPWADKTAAGLWL